MNFRIWREIKSMGEKTYALEFYCHGNKNLLVGIIARGFYIFSTLYSTIVSNIVTILIDFYYVSNYNGQKMHTNYNIHEASRIHIM